MHDPITPDAMNGKTGVLLVNTGSPDSLAKRDIKRYLNQFLMDERVMALSPMLRWLLVKGIIVPFRVNKSRAKYRRIWEKGGSLLLKTSEDLKTVLAQTLDKRFMVEIAMRYGRPSIEQGLSRLQQAGVTEVVVLPLFPQYASATTGTVMGAVLNEIGSWQVVPNIRAITTFYDHPGFIQAWVEKGRPYWEKQPNHVLFSFHGLPESHLRHADLSGERCLQSETCCEQDDPAFCYRAQCLRTAKMIAEGIGIVPKQMSVAFQSRLGKGEWIKPYTGDVIVNLAETGVKNLLVFCPSFVTDCLETVEEIGFEETDRFVSSGGNTLTLVPSLNCDSAWINCLVTMISGK